MVEAVPLTPCIATPEATTLPTAPVPAKPVSVTFASPETDSFPNAEVPTTLVG
jgi:hypothetical protein